MIYSILKKIFKKFKATEIYDFNKSNPLGGNGERIDIQNGFKINYESLDLYQKNHFKRYEFAKTIITKDEVCGDFACGTGYGSVMISDKAKLVIGADLDTVVINKIKERYKNVSNVVFINENLLDIEYENFFDTILSFETIEHFEENDIKKILKIFSKSLKKNGKLIFSTPYNQEKSEAALKLGFHLTFNIDEKNISDWLNEASFEIEFLSYQNYDTHLINEFLDKKEFIICVARKR